MLDVLSTIVGLVLRALFSNASFEVVAPILKRLLLLFGVKEVKVEAIGSAWAVIREGLQLFNVDKRCNPLLGAVREVKANEPTEIVALVHDTRRTIAALGCIFPIYQIPTAPEVPDPKSDVSKTLARFFAPGITAVFVLTRNEPHAIAMRENMRRGNFEPVLQEFYQVKVIRDSIAAHIQTEKTP